MQEKVYCFDLDGTLLDHDRAVQAAVEEFRKNFTCFDLVETNEFFELWHELSERYMNMYLEKRLSFSEQRRGRIRELFTTFGQDVGLKDADEKFDIFLTQYEANWCLFPEVEEVLESLKSRCKLGMITNGNADQQRKKFERFHLGKYFEVLVISGELGVSKPDKEIFHQFAKRIGEEPGKCSYIGDKLETDALAAKKAGLEGVWINRVTQENNTEIRTIHSLVELLL